MATLLLSVAGKAIGGSLLGGIGAAAGGILGAVGGSVIDGALFGAMGRRSIEGPRLSDLNVQSSSEGAPVPKVYGRVRLSGQIIWATPFEEVVRTEEQGGKGGGGGAADVTTYTYYGNFAIGLCEGAIAKVTRVWADGKPLDLRRVQMRVHAGTETQEPDSLIEAKLGAGQAPAYRGLAYVVFERLPLEPYGNRLPQLSFEVLRPVGGLETQMRAVTIIPGATEFGYDTRAVASVPQPGETLAENTHTFSGETDWTTSIDELVSICPNLSRAALVVSWFGTDLRAAQCQVRPGVELSEKETVGREWSVAGLARGEAYVVSQVDGRPAYGGTPSDESVIAAIRDLKTRNLKVLFYPFLMLDVPAENDLPNPYTGEAPQPPYPWRGEITVDPAPGRPGSPDGAAGARAAVESFFGSAAPNAGEWSWRRMVLHYAHLCVEAGGVDAFVVGTEMRGLTWLRDGDGAYPAVETLIALAEDVKAILGAQTKVSYAADWSEYFGHQPADGSGEVRFHLDPLWASDAVDMVGIDSYMPLADWRDGQSHADAAIAYDTYDAAYLAGNIAGGEGFDWYYVSDADRAGQVRTPISDGTHGEPWIYRYKDLVSWWSNAHHDRPGGVRSETPTAWVPRSKPIWFTEVGCPAVDKGPNRPNVFFDPKSSASALPYFSNGQRDDLVQRRYLEAVTAHFDPSRPGFEEASNPPSDLYDGRMVDHEAVHPWTWDARPYPAFPLLTDVWGDGPNWERGHWLTGRLGLLSMDRLIAAILDDYGFADYVVRPINGLATGYVIDRPMSARAAIEPLLLAFFGEALESDGRIVFRPRGGPVVAEFDADMLAVDDGSPDVAHMRAQETELPKKVSLVYTEGEKDHRRAAVTAIEPATTSWRETRAELALVSSQGAMQGAAEIWLKDVWAGRDRFTFALPPSMRGIEPADIVTLDWAGRRHVLQVQSVRDRGLREVAARRIDRGLFAPLAVAAREGAMEQVTPPVRPHVVVLDLPQIRADDPAHAPYLAASAQPWPGPLGLYRVTSGGGLVADGVIERPATTGETVGTLGRGPVGIWDRSARLEVRLYGGSLSSAEPAAVLSGTNAAALEVAPGRFEIMQFETAELVGERRYELRGFLRGQLGTEADMADAVPAGAAFVLLDDAVTSLGVDAGRIGSVLNYRIGAVGEVMGDEAFASVSVAVTGRGLKPWAPAHLRAGLEGDILRLDWVRRSRALSADNWALLETPDPEGRERYEVDLLAGGVLVSNITVEEPRVEIDLAGLRDAIGPAPSPLTVRVHHMSGAIGRGFAAEVTRLV